ncbi:hypothetical protein [Vibrio phage vB_pir03]|nr:hypothetical protein [Vibrio phage vB_pir03]
MFNINKERDYTCQYFLELIESGTANGKTLIINPQMLKDLNYSIPPHNGDIIFVGFDATDPLRIRRNWRSSGRVFIVNSIISTMSECLFEGGITLIESDMSIVAKMRQPRCDFFMDPASFEFYQEKKRHSKTMANLTIFVKPEEELRAELNASANESPKIDLLSYITITQPDLSSKETDSGIRIEGKTLKLYGPFLFDMTNIQSIDADIYLEDVLNQDLTGIEIKGDIDVTNRY